MAMPACPSGKTGYSMAAKYRSRRARIAALSDSLRAQGQTWAQVAARVAADERVNMRVAFRLAHGLSQREVAARLREASPAEAGATSMPDKIISYWETWPQSGYEPSLKSLKRLARVYQCNVGDLVDGGDYSHLDNATTDTAIPATTGVNAATAKRPALSYVIETCRPSLGQLNSGSEEHLRLGKDAFVSDSLRMSDRSEQAADIINIRSTKAGPALSPAITELCAAITDYGFSPARFCSV